MNATASTQVIMLSFLNEQPPPQTQLSRTNREIVGKFIHADMLLILTASAVTKINFFQLTSTYIDFNEYGSSKHSETMEHITNSVKNGGFDCHVCLMMVISVMRMNV